LYHQPALIPTQGPQKEKRNRTVRATKKDHTNYDNLNRSLIDNHTNYDKLNVIDHEQPFLLKPNPITLTTSNPIPETNCLQFF
jgi:hypothetical protein